jgi:hypothetical protein
VSLFSSFPSLLFKKGNMVFYFIFISGRWRHISQKSTRDRRPSMSRAASRSTSKRAYASGYALALPVLCSGRTRLSLAKAERGIIGRKAVRLFPFLLFISVVCFRCSCSHRPVYTDGMLYVDTSWSSRQPKFLISSGAELVDTIMVRFHLA